MTNPCPTRPQRSPLSAKPLAGIALAATIAGVATAINWRFSLLSALLVAIICGVLLRNLGLIPALCEPGLKITGKTILRTGVVLLGLRLSIPQIIALGWGPVIVIFLAVTVTFIATDLIGRAMKIPHTTRVLVATGCSICGAAAVAGMSAVVRRQGDQDEDVDSAAATAVAAVTLYGTLALLILPVITTISTLAPLGKGVWLGAAIHEVGQVVAAAGLAGGDILDSATVTKLGRVALLAPMVAIVGVIESRAILARRTLKVERDEVHQVLDGEKVNHKPAKRAGRTPLVPIFVLGFLAMVALRSVTGGIAALTPFFEYVNLIATFLLTMAMFSMGAGVNFRTLIRSGGKAMLLGLFSSLIIATITFGAVLAFV